MSTNLGVTHDCILFNSKEHGVLLEGADQQTTSAGSFGKVVSQRKQ